MPYKKIKNLYIDPQTRNWCKLSYPGHPNGCSNYNKSEQCPPKVKMVDEIFDITKSLYFIYIEFDLKAHANNMEFLHPDWSEKQKRCCLYWQNSIRKKLKQKCESLIGKNSDKLIYTLIPEAMGVNVFKTANEAGIPVKREAWPIIYKIALVGFKK